MKILYITDISINGYSGKEKATGEKIKSLRNVLNADFNYFSPKKNIKGVVLKFIYLMWFDFVLAFKILLFYRGFVIIERSTFLVITNSLVRVFKFKVFSEIHADASEELKISKKTKLEKIIINLFWTIKLKMLCKNSGMIYNNPLLKTHFDKKIICPSISIYNGANTMLFKPQKNEKYRKLFNIDKNDIVFLFIGSGSIWHGLEYLIEIFNHPKMLEKKNISLIIAGPNESVIHELTRSIINKNIFFTGTLNTTEAVEVINTSNLCLLPVRSIRISPGSPLKLYDYAACGKAIITQENLPGYSDEVLNYNLGITVDFTKADKAVKNLLDFIESFDENSFLLNNSKIANKIINWDNRIESWVKFISSVLHENQKKK